MAVFFVWVLIGIMIIAGLIFNANRKANPVYKDEPFRITIRWTSISVLILGFCLIIGIMSAFNP